MRQHQTRGQGAAAQAARADFTGVDIVDEVVRLCGMNLYLHGIGDGESPITSSDALASDPGDALRRGADQSAVRQEEQLSGHRRGRRGRHRARELRARRLHGHDLEQAAQLPAAHHDHPERRWPGGRGAAGQRAVRGAAPARGSAGGCWSSSTSTPCCGCRPASSTGRASRPTCCSSTSKPPGGRAVDQGAVDLRLPHQQALHAEEEPAGSARDLDDFVACYSAGERHKRKETERFQPLRLRRAASSATSSTSTSSGSRTTAWRTPRQPAAAGR